LKASWHLAGARTRVDIGGGRFAGLGLKTERRQIYRFGPQNQRGMRCGQTAVEEDTWHLHEACIKVKRSREGGVSVRWSSKNLDDFTPEGYLRCMLNGGRFGYWPGCLYIEKVGWLREGTPGHTSFASLIWRSSHLSCES